MKPELPNWLRIEVLPDEYMHWKCFMTSVVGVTHRNPDRTDRQEILMYCEPGQEVHLVRQPENKHDVWAIAVMTKYGDQIGWMPGGDFLLASHMDQGGRVSAKISKITGAEWGGPYGCVIEVAKWVSDPSKLAVFFEEGTRIQNIIASAFALESTAPKEAICKYVTATNSIRKLDQHPIAQRYRSVRYPINRLSLVLERQRRYKDCYRVITWWLGIVDKVGLLASDNRSVNKRLDRVKRLLSNDERSRLDARPSFASDEYLQLDL
jgi:hypothetical protein